MFLVSSGEADTSGLAIKICYCTRWFVCRGFDEDSGTSVI